jgi:hypothetical protein
MDPAGGLELDDQPSQAPLLFAVGRVGSPPATMIDVPAKTTSVEAVVFWNGRLSATTTAWALLALNAAATAIPDANFIPAFRLKDDTRSRHGADIVRTNCSLVWIDFPQLIRSE